MLYSSLLKCKNTLHNLQSSKTDTPGRRSMLPMALGMQLWHTGWDVWISYLPSATILRKLQ